MRRAANTRKAPSMTLTIGAEHSDQGAFGNTERSR
jgi:hypothetical protein